MANRDRISKSVGILEVLGRARTHEEMEISPDGESLTGADQG